MKIHESYICYNRGSSEYKISKLQDMETFRDMSRYVVIESLKYCSVILDSPSQDNLEAISN